MEVRRERGRGGERERERERGGGRVRVRGRERERERERTEDSGKRNCFKGSVCTDGRWSAVTGVNVGASSGILETDRSEIHSGPWSGISSTYKHRY